MSIILFVGSWFAGCTMEPLFEDTGHGGNHMSVPSQWITQFGTEEEDSTYDIAVDPEGNTYVAGYTDGVLSGLGSGSIDIFITRYDTSGEQVWMDQFGSEADDIPYAVTAGPDGYIYIAGSTFGDLSGTNNGYADVFIAKYDRDGNRIWTTQFGSPANERAFDMAVDPAGNIYLAGYTFGDLSGSGKSVRFDAFIAKYDTDGNRTWLKQSDTLNIGRFAGIAIDAGDGIYVTGETHGDLAGTGSAGYRDVFIRKYDTDGNEVWVSQFGTEYDDSGISIAADASGNTYVTGYTKADMAGPNSGYKDVFIAKHDPSGNMIWTRQFGSKGDDIGIGIAVDSSGNTYVTGYTKADLAGTDSGSKDVFIAKYDRNGNLLIKQFGSEGEDAGSGIAVDSSGNNYIAGDTDGDLASANSGSKDVFIAKNYESSVPPADATYSLGGTASGVDEAIELEFLVRKLYPDGSGTLLYGRASVEGDGPFVLGEFEDGSMYEDVKVATPRVACIVTNGSGTISGSDVTDIDVTCSNVPILTDIAAGYTYSVALKFDGTVWGWGSNGRGELGDGTLTKSATPVQAVGLTQVIAITAGASHTVALRDDGTVWAWGNNGSGQLGTATGFCSTVFPDLPCTATPVQVEGISDVTAVAAGAFHTVALRTDGTVWTWGSNIFGTLGDGTTTNRISPEQVPGLTDVTAIAAGSAYTLALKKDGTVWAWGNNGLGQLGSATDFCNSDYDYLPCSTIPLQVEGFSGATALAAGNSRTFALKADGTVWAWGSGLLGDGTTGGSISPVQVTGLTDVTAIAAGSSHTLALREDGTVWAWGDGSDGQLGDGERSSSPVPVQAYGLTDVKSIAAGYWFSLALKNDDTVWGWGDNYSDELGEGVTGSYSNVPVQVYWPL